MDRAGVASIDVGRAALKIALTNGRDEENWMKDHYSREGIKTAGVDFGGEFSSSIPKIIERAVVAAQREGIVAKSYVGAGAVAGAAHEAIEQVKIKALGFNVGGKIGIACNGDDLAVAVFMSIGMLNLNEMCVGVAHRSLKNV